MALTFALLTLFLLGGTFAAEPNFEYVGCFKDNIFRDLTKNLLTDKFMTSSMCSYHCRGFQFFSTQNGDQCFCGNNYGALGEDPNGCNKECKGDSEEMCGGFFRNSVYIYLPDRRIGATYVGCYGDGMFSRDLPHSHWENNRMTIAKCAAHCQGFKYMGVQFGSHCFCGDSYGKHGAKTACKSDCSGDGSETCGGFWANSIYSLGKKLDQCKQSYTCSVGQKIKKRKQNGPKPDKKEIWIPNHVASVFDTSGTVTSFSVRLRKKNKAVFLGIWRPIEKGSKYSLIGGKNFKSGSKGKHVVELTDSEYIEVQEGDTVGIHFLDGNPVSYGHGGKCKAKGLKHSIGKSTSKINIGDEKQFKNIKKCQWLSVKANLYCPGPEDTPKAGLTHPCDTLYTPNEPSEREEYTSIGCYEDSLFRDLPHRFWSSGAMTIDKCAAHCHGYKYFGVQNSDQCFCGLSYGTYGKDDNGCNKQCGGKGSEICGGWWRNSIYRLGDEEEPEEFTQIGCYKDKLLSRDLPERFKSDDKMTIEKCARNCLGYEYFGVQYAVQCFCGNSFGSFGEDKEGCNKPCKGNSDQICGDDLRNSVYRYGPAKAEEPEEPENPCATENGGCVHVCTNNEGNAVCSCNEGFTLSEDGTKCDKDDVNECESNNGGCDQVCNNFDNGFNCSCNSGFTLQTDGVTCDEDDVDECATNNGGCEQICTNTDGSFKCSCREGYSLHEDGLKCIVDNPCEINNGGCKQVCTNNNGKAGCSCREGFTMNEDGVTCDENDVNECESSNGGCDHVCTNTDGSFTCSCNSGYSLNADGATCDKDTVEIVNCATSNGGCQQVCIQEDDKFECDCNPGFILTADKTTCEEYEPIPEAMFMIQAYSPTRDRVCYNVDFGSAKYLRLLHDTTNDIIVNGELKESSKPGSTYFSAISFKRGDTYIQFGYDKVTIGSTEYDWASVPASEGEYEILQKRPGQAIIVKFRVGRRQVQLLFDKSVEFATQAQRVDFTIFRNQGLSLSVKGVIGEHYKATFGTVGSPEKLYSTEAQFKFGSSTLDAVSLRHYNSRNGRTMQCWEMVPNIAVKPHDILTSLKD